MVKSEIFGTRESILKGELIKIKAIKVVEKIWFCTCIRKHNSNPLTRYLFLVECQNKEDFLKRDISSINEFTKIKIPIIKVLIKNNQISFFNSLSSKVEIFPYNDKTTNYDPSKYLLKIINCCQGEMIPAKTRLIKSDAVSDLSRFLRKDMFGRVVSADLDFFILNKDELILIEEKLFLDNDGNGNIGLGQYLSFREILKDVLNLDKNIKWYIFFRDIHEKRWMVYNFLKEAGNVNHNKKRDEQKNETVVIIKKEDMDARELNDLIKNG